MEHKCTCITLPWIAIKISLVNKHLILIKICLKTLFLMYMIPLADQLVLFLCHRITAADYVEEIFL